MKVEVQVPIVKPDIRVTISDEEARMLCLILRTYQANTQLYSNFKSELAEQIEVARHAK